ncbi:hypothetical protein G6F40_017089 [Rhizopus arrhizus]|nr:hypothetical protein G6F40_017089 [Rhizopus arrhizus]KAG1223909.1 hypothetical protein G6F68_020228 [Rhizopus microsporus]
MFSATFLKMIPKAMVAMIQPNSDRVLMAGRTPTRSTIHAQADQRQPDQRAQHQGFALAEVQGARGGESKLVSERDDGIDHA